MGEYIKEIEEAYEMATQLLNESDDLWEVVGHTAGFDTKKRKEQFVPVENSGISVIKASGKWQITHPEDIQEFIYNCENRKSWDSNCLFIKPVETIQPPANSDIKRIEVMHQGLSLPFPVTNRDFVLLRSYKVENGNVLSVGRSTHHSSIPETSKYIRGRIVIDVMQIKKVGSHCEVVYIAQADPRGSIPTFMVNLGATTVPATVSGIEKAYHKHKEK